MDSKHSTPSNSPPTSLLSLPPPAPDPPPLPRRASAVSSRPGTSGVGSSKLPGSARAGSSRRPSLAKPTRMSSGMQRSAGTVSVSGLSGDASVVEVNGETDPNEDYDRAQARSSLQRRRSQAENHGSQVSEILIGGPRNPNGKFPPQEDTSSRSIVNTQPKDSHQNLTSDALEQDIRSSISDLDPTEEVRKMKEAVADLMDEDEGSISDLDLAEDAEAGDVENADHGDARKDNGNENLLNRDPRPTMDHMDSSSVRRSSTTHKTSTTTTAATLKSIFSSMHAAGSISLDLHYPNEAVEVQDSTAQPFDPDDPSLRALAIIAEAEARVTSSAFVTINPAASPSSATGQTGPSASLSSSPADTPSSVAQPPVSTSLPPIPLDVDLPSLRAAITTLSQLLRSSRQSENILRRHVDQLSTHLRDDAQRVRAALAAAVDDRARMARIKKELRRAWRMVERCGEREARARKEIEAGRGKRARLGDPGELDGPKSDGEDGEADGVPLSLSKKYTSTEEMKDKRIEQLETELSELRASFTTLDTLHQTTTSAYTSLHTAHTQLQSSHTHLQSVYSETSDALGAARRELDRVARERERAEAMRTAEHEVAERARDEATRAVAEAQARQQEVAQARHEARDAGVMVERAQGDLERALGRVARAQADAAERGREVEALLGRLKVRDEELRAAQAAGERWREECGAAGRRTEGLERRVRRVDSEVAKAGGEKEEYKNKYTAALHDLSLLRTANSLLQHSRDSALRDRDMLDKKLREQETQTRVESERTQQQEQARMVAEREVGGLRRENGKMRKIILALERARDAQLAEANSALLALQEREEDVKVAELQAVDRGKKIAEMERKLGEQQALYESVRADRNLYSKHLLEAESSASHLRNKLDTVAHQCAQLKEELASKEVILQRTAGDRHKLEARCDAMARDVAKAEDEVRGKEEELRRIRGEVEALHRNVEEAEKERSARAKLHAAVIVERDGAMQQLVKARKECALLTEKVDIQRLALERGEAAYAARGEDVRILRMEVRRLRRERAIVGREAGQVGRLKEEVVGVRRELIRERARVKVLEEELETPLNVHRWRALWGTDPTMSQLIAKVKLLQRRLIAKTEEVVDREQSIAQRDNAYQRLKEQLGRAPGAEVVRSLMEAREAAKAKGKECKALASELTMYATHLAALRSDVTRLSSELQLEKKRHFLVKKRLHEREKREREMREALGAGTSPGVVGVGGQVAEAVAALLEKAAVGGTGKKRVDPGLTLLPRYVGGGYLVSKPVAT
ncbi:hypothetical protein HDU93_009403 [Gonapodya sp. JEL0774]|nr:hypothetical protein HDU93_009403 [Gonapodya sp. JEL0774]